jgi:DNA-binding CsgD family transcriptional regulator
MPNGRKGKKWPMMPRQRQILELYKDGFTSARIAEKMEISVHTLYTHLKRIYYKLEVHNIKDAIERGLR